MELREDIEVQTIPKRNVHTSQNSRVPMVQEFENEFSINEDLQEKQYVDVRAQMKS